LLLSVFKATSKIKKHNRINSKTEQNSKPKTEQTMGASTSSTKNEQVIMDEMALNAGKWNSRRSSESQTQLFRRIVPTEEGDFSGAFLENQLDCIFTSDKVVLGGGSYNSNFLFRDSRKETKIPVYSDENYTALHPLGEPGRDLGPGHYSKISHMMVIKHSETGPITFNEMLPSTLEEQNDLESRIAFAKKAVENMKANVPLSQCGEKVIAKARSQGIDTRTGIRDYLAYVISYLPADVRNGRPGYKLFNKDNVDVVSEDFSLSARRCAASDLLDEVYGSEDLKLFITVQAPSENSQLLSHLHCFMLDSVPASMEESYRDVEVIHRVKKEHMELIDHSEEEGEEGLARQSTVPVGGD
jgi:hypothetical protein